MRIGIRFSFVNELLNLVQQDVLIFQNLSDDASKLQYGKILEYLLTYLRRAENSIDFENPMKYLIEDPDKG